MDNNITVVWNTERDEDGYVKYVPGLVTTADGSTVENTRNIFIQTRPLNDYSCAKFSVMRDGKSVWFYTQLEDAKLFAEDLIYIGVEDDPKPESVEAAASDEIDMNEWFAVSGVVQDLDNQLHGQVFAVVKAINRYEALGLGLDILRAQHDEHNVILLDAVNLSRAKKVWDDWMATKDDDDA